MSKTQSLHPDDAALDTPAFSISCAECGSSIAPDPYRTGCARCGGAFVFDYPERDSRPGSPERSMWRFRDLLPMNETSPIVTMQEGGTPLIPARENGGLDLYFKNEMVNPTGSHKDRSLSVGITKALEFGFDTCMLYSDGSAALSSAAYAARAGLRNITVVPQGTPDLRLLPLMAYGSTVLEYAGAAADALDWVREICVDLRIYETTTYRRANPYQAEAPKTIAYEIAEQLEGVAGWVVVPVGGGGTLAGIWRGFCDLNTRGELSRLPRMLGVVPEGYSILQQGLGRGVDSDLDLRALQSNSNPRSAQAKLAMAFPPDGVAAIRAIRDSGGLFVEISDGEALSCQMDLAAKEGLYAEISASVSLAAVRKLTGLGVIAPAETVVALLCGSGFRETAELARSLSLNKIRVDRATGKDKLERLLRT